MPRNGAAAMTEEKPKHESTGEDRPRIIIVDDEEMVLTSLRALIELEMEHTVTCFSTPGAALEDIQSGGADLVIADYQMPEMDGIEFLSRVRAIDREVTRILLTGYADKESAIRAINEVGLYQYIEKPWDNEQLLLVVKNGLEKRLLIRELREKIAELDTAHAGLNQVQMKLIKAFV